MTEVNTFELNAADITKNILASLMREDINPKISALMNNVKIMKHAIPILIPTP